MQSRSPGGGGGGGASGHSLNPEPRSRKRFAGEVLGVATECARLCFGETGTGQGADIIQNDIIYNIIFVSLSLSIFIYTNTYIYIYIHIGI